MDSLESRLFVCNSTLISLFLNFVFLNAFSPSDDLIKTVCRRLPCCGSQGTGLVYKVCGTCFSAWSPGTPQLPEPFPQGVAVMLGGGRELFLRIRIASGLSISGADNADA